MAYLLSTLAEHNVHLTHKSGKNHPGDYDSRHPLECDFGKKCQVCVFAHNLAGPMAQELAHPNIDPKISSSLPSLKTNQLENISPGVNYSLLYIHQRKL